MNELSVADVQGTDETSHALGDALVSSQFIYQSAPFPSCHASTIAETRSGFAWAFFGGTHERHVDVCIWYSSLKNGRWSEPREVANGIDIDGTRYATWNPVLFTPRGGPLMLFYKVGPSPQSWWGMVKTSEDDGKT